MHIRPPYQIAPCILDVPYETNRPVDLPENLREAAKAGKLLEWLDWHEGFLQREIEAAAIFKKRMLREIETFGLAAVEAAFDY